MGQGLSGWVAENRKPILNGNPSVEPGYLNDPAKFSTLRSALAVPLEGTSGVVGVLTLYHADRDAFTKDHLRILLAINAKIALSIENALRFRQAETSATTDYLTGLPNARSLFLQLDAELSRSRRSEQPLAVLVLDLDGFKQVNDRFGHLEGNRVLRAVGAGLKSACREYDYVARMGGDEFVVVLPGARPGEINAKFEQIRSVISQVSHEMFSGSDADREHRRGLLSRGRHERRRIALGGGPPHVLGKALAAPGRRRHLAGVARAGRAPVGSGQLGASRHDALLAQHVPRTAPQRRSHDRAHDLPTLEYLRPPFGRRGLATVTDLRGDCQRLRMAGLPRLETPASGDQ